MTERSHDVEIALEYSQPAPTSILAAPSKPIQVLCITVHPPKFILELWRRIRMEIVVELPMLKQRWMIIVFGLIMQYVHGMFTQLAHRMHEPQEEPLPDLGFELTPELGPEKHWVSESIFGTLFLMFVVWTFTPFILQRKRFYTVVMWSRLLMVLVVCQALRIITFSVTRLPGPSFHCRAGEPFATRPWPEHWSGHVVVDVQRAASKSCGDLIFSSHTTFMLTGILAYNEYGNLPIMRGIAWVAGAIVSCLIVASRKHYTVDIVIAWYTVPLVFYTLHRRWTTRRPMSELLGALGENDEPDPSFPDIISQDTGAGVQDQVQVLVDGRGNTDGKALLSHPKERTTSTAKLSTLDENHNDHGAGKTNGGMGSMGMGMGMVGMGNMGQRSRASSTMQQGSDTAHEGEGSGVGQRPSTCRVS